MVKREDGAACRATRKQVGEAARPFPCVSPPLIALEFNPLLWVSWDPEFRVCLLWAVSPAPLFMGGRPQQHHTSCSDVFTGLVWKCPGCMVATRAAYDKQTPLRSL